MTEKKLYRVKVSITLEYCVAAETEEDAASEKFYLHSLNSDDHAYEREKNRSFQSGN